MIDTIKKTILAGVGAAVVTKDKVLHLESTGLADVASKRPMVAVGSCNEGRCSIFNLEVYFSNTANTFKSGSDLRVPTILRPCLNPRLMKL